MELPTYLYKYRAVDGLLARMLVNHEVWYAPVASFNDPFDCAPDVHSSMTRDELADSIASTIKRNEPHLNRRERAAKAKLIFKHHPLLADGRLGSQASDAALRKVFRNTIDRCGVLCLSEVPDVVLMWSHYAREHRGICVRFKTEGMPFNSLGKVRYDAERPRVNPTVDRQDGMARAILTKADYWSYEREWRALMSRYSGAVSFNSGQIDGITLGARITATDELKVRELADQGGLKVEWSRATFDDHRFRLNIIPT